MDYKLIEREGDAFYTVELTGGEYVGVKFQYGKVSVQVIEENGEEVGQLSFTWKLIEGDESLENNAEFQDYVGRVLQEIIEEAFKSGEYKIGNGDGESGNNDTEKLD